MSESTHELPAIKLALGSRPEVRLFRNNVGSFVIGDPPRRVHTGLYPGSGDLIGWNRYQIQPADVGATVAVFLSVEVKTPTSRTAKDRLEKQRNWARQIQQAGGIAFFASTTESAIEQIEAWRPAPGIYTGI